MALTGGTSPVEYLKGFNITLFLTSYEDEVTDAIRRGTVLYSESKRLQLNIAVSKHIKMGNFHVFVGFPSAVMSLQPMNSPSETQLRIAFDLDAVLFSDESERIFKEQGLDAFLEHEIQKRYIPLSEVS